MCLCVCGRERERERKRQTERETGERIPEIFFFRNSKTESEASLSGSNSPIFQVFLFRGGSVIL